MYAFEIKFISPLSVHIALIVAHRRREQTNSAILDRCRFQYEVNLPWKTV